MRCKKWGNKDGDRDRMAEFLNDSEFRIVAYILFRWDGICASFERTKRQFFNGDAMFTSRFSVSITVPKWFVDFKNILILIVSNFYEILSNFIYWMNFNWNYDPDRRSLSF